MNHSVRSSALLSLICCVLLPGLWAQRTIYDGARDKTAQDAVTAAKDVGAGSVFAAMLRNMDEQAKRETATALDFARQQMRARLENFTYWKHKDDTAPVTVGAAFISGICHSVECELKTVKAHIEFELKPVSLTDDQIKQRLADLDTRKKDLDAAIQALKDASKSKDPLVVRSFAFIDENGKDILDYAHKIAALTTGGKTLKGISGGLDEIGKGLDEMLGVYNAVKGIFAGYKAVEPDPASLRPPQAQTELQLLALEQEHLKTLSLIRAKAKIDSAITLEHIEGTLNRLQAAHVLVDGAKVEASLSDAVKAHDRDRLIMLLDALHEAEAALAEEDLAAKLGSIRESDEARRYSIRRSAVNSSTYDLTIQAASQRLAVYWKSGIKPTDVASLLFYLTNTVTIPVIATH